jgi:hypothetical protein
LENLNIFIARKPEIGENSSHSRPAARHVQTQHSRMVGGELSLFQKKEKK